MQLVESMVAELWIRRAECKVKLGFLAVWRVSTPNHRAVQGSTVLYYVFFN